MEKKLYFFLFVFFLVSQLVPCQKDRDAFVQNRLVIEDPDKTRFGRKGFYICRIADQDSGGKQKREKKGGEKKHLLMK